MGKLPPKADQIIRTDYTFAIQPPEPTWGNLLIGAQDYLYASPGLAFAPGLAIALTLLTIYGWGIKRAIGPAANG